MQHEGANPGGEGDGLAGCLSSLVQSARSARRIGESRARNRGSQLALGSGRVNGATDPSLGFLLSSYLLKPIPVEKTHDMQVKDVL